VEGRIKVKVKKIKLNYLAIRVVSQCQFLQVLDAVPGDEPEGAGVSALSADRLVLAPVRAVLLDADAPPLVDLRLQCNVGSDLIYDADFGHLRHTRTRDM
jgi:hypothetical protein